MVDRCPGEFKKSFEFPGSEAVRVLQECPLDAVVVLVAGLPVWVE